MKKIYNFVWSLFKVPVIGLIFASEKVYNFLSTTRAQLADGAKYRCLEGRQLKFDTLQLRAKRTLWCG